ncbi:cytochrome P450 [Gymnopilus junonius]|uniref:Cytochrome P450 n=1 Tax=Gymnopilus junonius TaxID=109634 RepID=A0A9P5NIJ5_GYMJU|nr:cytochrome P450 [Gymnopilus junonius]
MSPVLILRLASQAATQSPIHLFGSISGIVISVLFLRVFYNVYLYPRFRSPLRHLPGPPLGHPVYGQFLNIINGEAGIPQREWVKQFGPIVRVVGPIGIERLMFLKPEALQKVLINDWVEYPRPAFMRKILSSVTGNGLLTVTGNEHKQMRKAMNPAFSLPNLMAQSDMYYGPIEALSNILRTEIDAEKEPNNGKVLLMYEWLGKVTLDIICETAFGYQSDSLHNPRNELAEAYERLTSLQTGPNMARFIAVISVPGASKLVESEWAYNHRHWFEKFEHTRHLSSLLESMHRIRNVSAAMLREKMRDSIVPISDSETKRDIMSILVRARKADLDSKAGGYAMSDEAMMDQVLTFLGAGHETTASGLAWTLWLLAKDLKSQQKLREEVTPLVGLRDESLRLMPPVPMTFREAGKTDYIDGVLIRVINTWKELWGEDAEEFNPARWLNLPPEYNSVFSSLSFLAGPHGCIGKTMAIVEMKAVLSALIANFEFEPAYAGQVPQPTAAVTMKPLDNMPLRVRRVK